MVTGRGLSFSTHVPHTGRSRCGTRSIPPRPSRADIATFNSSVSSRDFFSSLGTFVLLLFPATCHPWAFFFFFFCFFYAATAKTRLSQWNPDRHAVLSFRVERKQLLAVARQLQIWVITLPRPSSTDPPPLLHQSVSQHKQTRLQLLHGMSLSVCGGVFKLWERGGPHYGLCGSLLVTLLLPSVDIRMERQPPRKTRCDKPVRPLLITSWPQCDGCSQFGSVTYCQMAELASNQLAFTFIFFSFFCSALLTWLNAPITPGIMQH